MKRLLLIATACMLSLGLWAEQPAPRSRFDLRAAGFPITRNPDFFLPNSATLDYLDDDHLLVTFNVRRLIEPDERGVDHDARIIRGLVLDARTGRLERQAEWRTGDREPYLWVFGPGPLAHRFLLRSGQELLLMDATLTVQRRFGIRQQFLDLSLAPDGTQMVLQTTDPDEQRVELNIFQLEPFARLGVKRLSAPVALALGEGGVVQAEALGERRWAVRLAHSATQVRTLLEVRSICPPSIEFLSADVLSVMSCEDAVGGRGRIMTPSRNVYFDVGQMHYATVSLDGEALATGGWSRGQIRPRLIRSAGGRRFAVELLDGTSDAYVPIEELKGSSVYVYDVRRTADRPVFKISVRPLNRMDAAPALSPDGRSLAVLRDGAVEIYGVP